MPQLFKFNKNGLPSWFSPKILTALYASGFNAYVVPEKRGPTLYITTKQKRLETWNN